MLRQENARVPDVRKIAVLRANQLGDYIVAVPALEALRRAYPNAEIVLLGRDWHAAFLRHRPGPIDRVVPIPDEWDSVRGVLDREHTPALDLVVDALAAEHFDLALQIHGGGRHSNPLIRLLDARCTAGLRTPDAAPLDRWVPYVYYQHETLRFLEVTSLVGAASAGLEPQIIVTPEDLSESCRVVPAEQLPLVALHPGASDSRRRWSPEKFAAVGDALAATGARVVVTGTAGERAAVEAVVHAMQAEALDLCDRLSLNGLAGLLARCVLLVSNDTGPRHLAAAVGTATASIYWCGNLVNAGPLTRTWHRPAISWRQCCPACGIDTTRDQCTHRCSFVDDVPVEEVTEYALDLFARATYWNLGDLKSVFAPA